MQTYQVLQGQCNDLGRLAALHHQRALCIFNDLGCALLERALGALCLGLAVHIVRSMSVCAKSRNV